MRQRFHPEARAEFLAAAEWYDRERPGLGQEFIKQVAKGLDALTSLPATWPILLRAGDATLRRFVLPRFPYTIVYTIVDENVVIVAIVHGKRRPGYWKTRLAHDS